ncbi:hypothetical protein K0M31_012617 [Melipona bicolor]|uniref:Uncharacterized protein n=1 Tax=Melipona bicolor TaxID=60889 RepID=A0AA40FK08_9HYME|nr:hypothetical protein K0M31_012617 [Melipona bicolor]
MDDEKPSHFLQRMRSMIDKKVPDTVLRTIFLEQIPQSLHNILVVSHDADLSTLAVLADRIMEFRLSQISSIDRANMAVSACQSRADGGFHENNLAGSHQSRENLVAMQHQLAEMTHRIGNDGDELFLT